MLEREKMYSIGQLAEMSNASVKQLRYLDEKGILVPKMRNKENNYRYYEHDQLNQLVIIKTLRDLGFSFEEVVHILEAKDNDQFIESLQRQMERADAEIKEGIFRYERLVAYYTQLLKSQGMNQVVELQQKEENIPSVIKIVEVPKQTVICARHRASATSRQLFIDRYFELQKFCTEKRIATFSSMMAYFHDGYMKQFDDVAEDLETMVPIHQEYPLSKDVRSFGGFKGVMAIHKGHYKNMKGLYLQMEAWARGQGLELMDSSLEIYHLGPDMAPDSDSYITQLVIPLRDSVL
ncbi:MerR family transcriptional regulator [Ruminococcaceae bacterium OttesenSCG-928-I18]|nr:MerR family transcriptional regulator [Ruminococcaceae bacterium OttesenSCG-928-I18]